MSALYERITGAALGLVKPYSSSELPPVGDVLAYLRSHIGPLRRVLMMSMTLTVLTAGIEVWLISYTGRLIDLLADTSPDEVWQRHGRELLAAALVVLLLRPAVQFMRHAVNDIGFNCNAATLFRWRAHDHLTRQSIGWFQQDLTGRTATRLVDIGNHGSDILYNAFNAMAFGLVYMAGIIVLMAGTDLRLALPLLLWLVLYVALLLRIIPRMVRAQQTFQSAKSALVGSVVDGFSNIDTLRLFADRESIVDEHRKGLENTRQTLFRTRQIAVSLRSTLVALEGAIIVGFVGYGIWLWSVGSATIGLIGAAVALSLRITTMAEWILDAVWTIFLRVGSLREALRTVAQPLTIPVDDDAPSLVVRGGEIEFRDLRHSYGLGQGGLDGVSLTVRAGEKVGLVGRSGAGKSSLVNLLLRFHDTEGGRIRVDGQDVRGVDPDSLRAAIGMVSQQASLLNRSIRDNIALGMDDVDDARIVAAARQACAHDFIVALQDTAGRSGYDAHVGERGVRLSGGQRQRIALARVILKGAPILILDEATSALDSEVESEIQSALATVMQGRTVIAIAHRLSTIARMDRIVVIDAGRIVEHGTHADLMEENGLYASFWRRQSGGLLGAEPERRA